MVDMPVDRPAELEPRQKTSARFLELFQRALLAILVGLGAWAAVSEVVVEDRCKTRLGKLSVQLKLDSYYSGCKCMKHSLDFSDPCNSMYIPMLH